MAGLTNKPQAREQFAAILQARWLMFLHGLRTAQGKMEVFTRILFGGMAAIGGLGGAVAFGAGAYYFVSRGHTEALALLLWPVMLFWQLFPIVSTAFSGSIDSSNLVRFPLSYRSYYLIQLIDGLIGPASLLPCLWLLGILLGVGFGSPALFLPAAVVLATFGITNLLLSRMVLSWVERWMEQRRTREIFGLVFFLLMMSMQLIGPVVQRFEHKQRQVSEVAQRLSALQKPLPPGAATEAIANVTKGDFARSALYFALLAGYGAAFLWLLGVRLRAQYRGENLSEVAPKDSVKISRRLRTGWNVLGLPGPIAAMFQKEIRYLFRSGQMLLALLSPILVMMLFRFQAERGNPLMRTSSRAFQLGAALSVLSVMNMFQNSFGGDGGGLQLLYAAPVKFRQVVLGKNLALLTVFAVELSVVSVALAIMGLIPPLAIAISTVAAAAFAVIAEATVGNLLSLYVPKKIDYGKFNRQQASPVAVFTSMGVTLAIFGLCALALFVSPKLGSIWIATAIMCVLACVAAVAYLGVLNQVDRIALAQRERLLQEVCRT